MYVYTHTHIYILNIYTHRLLQFTTTTATRNFYPCCVTWGVLGYSLVLLFRLVAKSVRIITDSAVEKQLVRKNNFKHYLPLLVSLIAMRLGTCVNWDLGRNTIRHIGEDRLIFE